MKIKIIGITILLTLSLLAAAGNAALSIETFTCNSQSGTAVVENGATFSCQASIKNEDTQSSANLASVTLLVDGNWAEQTSYTGTGFGTSISAGASTTATFSGIRGVSPGATNKFQSIQLDSSTDTFVTNTNVNVITIKSLTVSSSSSSVASGGEFDVSATVIAGGDLGSVTLTWSGSGGCSLASGHTAAKSAGALSHNTEATRSWRVTQSSSDCVNTVTASGTASSVTTTKSKSVTVTSTGSSGSTGSTSGGGGGGGGAGGVGVAKAGESKSIKQIIAGVSTTLEFTKTALNNIVIEVVNAANNVVINIEEVAAPSVPTPSGNVYKYLDIKITNLSDDNIRSAKITFSVNKTWLQGKDKSSVRLNRYVDKWEELPTTLADENATHVRYTATTQGFSVFAVTARAATVQEQQPQQKPGEQPPAQEQVPVQVPGVGSIEIPKPLMDYSLLILVIVLVVIVILGWFHYHGPGRKMKKVEYHWKPLKK
ncbi:MAG: PGF-pre-PGF domain-containing protein [Candidatus Aenigmarchaeota archaeon]|nr:PGF-pre-PGF domain-containing protein [Candidatus Aenigmarchaeota archaeon]